MSDCRRSTSGLNARAGLRPARLIAFRRASNSLATSANSFGTDIIGMDLMRALQGPIPAGADGPTSRWDLPLYDIISAFLFCPISPFVVGVLENLLVEFCAVLVTTEPEFKSWRHPTIERIVHVDGKRSLIGVIGLPDYARDFFE